MCFLYCLLCVDVDFKVSVVFIVSRMELWNTILNILPEFCQIVKPMERYNCLLLLLDRAIQNDKS